VPQVTDVRESSPERTDTFRLFAAAAGVCGFLAIAIGAFGAHALQDFLASLPDGAKREAWWATGVRYHAWHALLLLGIALLDGRAHAKALRLAGWLSIAGVTLFSGSLYLTTLTGVRWLGAITPLGGLCFLGAWLAIAIAALKR
jgi:uncharacterized membrane protein YgdD (TMEM256/DUF423 family)